MNSTPAPYLRWTAWLFLMLALSACGAPSVATIVPGTPASAGTATTAPASTAVVLIPTATSAPATPTVGVPTSTVAPTATAAPSATAVVTSTAVLPTPTAAASGPTPIPPTDARRADVFLMLANYFDAISRKDYAAAAAYHVREGGGTPAPSIAAKLAADYAGVSAVVPVVNPFVTYNAGAGSQFAPVPTLLLITLANGGVRYQAGCVQTRRANPTVFVPPRDTGWEVGTETFSAVATADVNSLSSSCGESGLPGPFDSRGSPVDVLTSLYDAINRNDYARAYAYWEQPPSGLTEAQFAQGYADTASVFVAVRPPLRYDGAAGSTYAPLPSLLIATNRDSSKHAFVGCFVARRVNPQVSGAPDTGWRIYSGTLSATAGNSTSATLLPATCP